MMYKFDTLNLLVWFKGTQSLRKQIKTFSSLFKGWREEKHECWEVIFWLLFIIYAILNKFLILRKVSLKFKNLFSNLWTVLRMSHSLRKCPSTHCYIIFTCCSLSGEKKKSTLQLFFLMCFFFYFIKNNISENQIF